MPASSRSDGISLGQGITGMEGPMPRLRSARIVRLLTLMLVTAVAAVGAMMMTFDGGGASGGSRAGEFHFGW